MFQIKWLALFKPTALDDVRLWPDHLQDPPPRHGHLLLRPGPARPPRYVGGRRVGRQELPAGTVAAEEDDPRLVGRPVVPLAVGEEPAVGATVVAEAAVPVHRPEVAGGVLPAPLGASLPVPPAGREPAARLHQGSEVTKTRLWTLKTRHAPLAGRHEKQEEDYRPHHAKVNNLSNKILCLSVSKQ